jgi:hypothetical protein
VLSGSLLAACFGHWLALVQVLGSGAAAFALRGIPNRTEVGFLSLLEALRYSKVRAVAVAVAAGCRCR